MERDSHNCCECHSLIFQIKCLTDLHGFVNPQHTALKMTRSSSFQILEVISGRERTTDSVTITDIVCGWTVVVILF